MQPTRIASIVGCLATLVLCIRCNIYSPFTSASSQEDFLEEALKCLHNDDIDCAIENYQKLPEGALKQQKLCTGYLTKAGFTLDAFLNVITKISSTMLGNLAQRLMPWTNQKSVAANTAYIHCNQFFDTSPDTQLGVLLLAMGTYVDCATRMGRSDIQIGVDNADTSCITPGNNNGLLEPSDIGPIAGDPPGMCASDVTICQSRFEKLDSFVGIFTTADLTEIAAAYELIPDEIKSTVIGINAGRAAARTTVPPP